MDFMQVCAVCNGRLFPRTRVGRNADAYALTPCGHVFHRECAEQWVRRNQTCPTCRARVQNGRRIYLAEDTNKRSADNNSTRRKDVSFATVDL
jgi:hypothetical protein